MPVSDIPTSRAPDKIRQTTTECKAEQFAIKDTTHISITFCHDKRSGSLQQHMILPEKNISPFFISIAALVHKKKTCYNSIMINNMQQAVPPFPELF